MKISHYICLIGLGLAISCGTPQKPADPPVTNDSTSTIVEKKVMETPQVKETGSPVYVFAQSGLNLREGPDPKSEKIMTVPYGAKLSKFEDTSTEEMMIDGLKGRMGRVSYQDKTGYMFTGYLCQYPAPKKEMEAKDYVSLLQKEGKAAEFVEDRLDDGGYIQDTKGFKLETNSWQECFLIAKAMYDIPAKINLPAKMSGEEIIVANPDKEEYLWSDELVIHLNKDGKTIKDMYYYLRGEGGGRTVLIEPTEKGLQILEILIAD